MNLNLKEIISLHYELNGLTKNNQDGQPEVVLQGILKQKMSLKAKVYLQRLNKVVAEEIKLYEDTRKELFDKYGKQTENDIVIENDNIEKFNEEHEEILNAEKTIDVTALWSADLTLDSLSSIETDEYYPVLFKLIDK
jgi:acylphosphatase